VSGTRKANAHKEKERMKMKSSLTDDRLDLRPVELTAEEATQRRMYASRNGFEMPVSQYERNLYAARCPCACHRLQQGMPHQIPCCANPTPPLRDEP